MAEDKPEEAKTEEATPAPGGKSVDLTDKDSMKVNIADALNEQDIVKFTVHTKTTLDRFAKKDFQVTRTHEEFIWLHSQYLENEKYAGYIIPPAPPKPDFSQSHGKLAKLQSDADMPQEELQKLRQEIQSEYLAAFQKTVAMHEVFLIRLSLHPVFRDESSLQLFLEYEKELETKKKSGMDRARGAFFSAMGSVVSGDVLATTAEPEQNFARYRDFVLHYLKTITDCSQAAEIKIKQRSALVSQLSGFNIKLTHLGNTQANHHVMSDIMRKCGSAIGTMVAIEKKLVAKEDLKMSDLLRYYRDDTNAAKELLVRRAKAHKEMEKTAKAHEAAKRNGKKVIEAQGAATAAKTTYEAITKSAQTELETFKKRRAAAFRKGLIHYAQCQIKQSKDAYALWKQTLIQVRDIAN